MRAGIRLSWVIVCFITVDRVTAAPTNEEIQKSIQAAGAYLKGQLRGGGGGGGPVGGIGQTALTGLALLEAGYPEDDPVLKSIIAIVRENALAQVKVYDASLTIMFLDRLGDRADSPFIQVLGLRLTNTIGARGAWSYDCDFGVMSAEEMERFRKDLSGEGRLQGGSKGNATGKGSPKGDSDPKKKMPPAADKPAANALHPEVVRWLQGARPSSKPSLGGGDNSNTQFAIVAMWCSRKHAVPVDNSLQAAAKHFRQSQNPDGGWSYKVGGLRPNSTPQMTCAGLISQAISYGLKAHRDAPPKLMADATIKAGFDCLGKFVDGRANAGNLTSDIYFLWSLERMAVIYGIDRVGKTNWYEWGAQALIASQSDNGSWMLPTEHIRMAEVNTAFAVLFLCKANLAKDLSGKLRPGESALKNRPGGPDLKSSGPGVDTKPPAVASQDPSNASDVDADAARLCDSLVNAKPDARPAIIAELRDSKGSVYTVALARAAGKLSGEPQQQVREALAKRLTRMTASTLRDMLGDVKDREIRLGSATACGLKADRQFIPDLIEALNDLDSLVQKAAHSSLTSLSSKDFGPEQNASASDKEKAIKAWRAWWKVQVK